MKFQCYSTASGLAWLDHLVNQEMEILRHALQFLNQNLKFLHSTVRPTTISLQLKKFGELDCQRNWRIA